MNSASENFKCTVLVIKIVSRCNLNCTYCYMYNMGDTTYKGQPKVMADEVVNAMLQRTKEHCVKNEIKNFQFIFHGGEPLLAGENFFRKFVEKANKLLLPETQPHFAMQTNGVLLTEDWCKLFAELNIIVGVSLDGTKEENDKFRIHHSGKGAYDEIVKGLNIANNSPHLKNKPGVLSVININADPVKTYEHFKQLQVKGIDFLLPDSTYEHPPVKQTGCIEEGSYYADWLIKIFDKWFYEKEEKPQIRLFESIISMILGESVATDTYGVEKNETLVIETNGSIEAVDVLKICGDGFTKAGANVLTHGFEEAMQTELAKLYHLSHSILCKKCLSCPVNEICGGGFLPHRYSKKNGFNNPSVYCNDLLKLISHIQNAVFEQMPASVLESAGVQKLTYEDALSIIDEEMKRMDEPDHAIQLEYF